MIKEAVLFIITLCPLSMLSLAETKFLHGFSIDLIHRDSQLSPFYISSMTQSEVIKNAALRSISRINLFRLSSAYENKAESVMIPNEGDYLMRFFVGTPPVESLAVADTGSDLIWVQCLPCEQCYPQNAPIFDPKKSSTFKVMSCDSKSCTSLSRYGCGSSNQCRYYYSYGDKSFTVGDLASDTINIGSNHAVTLPQSVLGCAHDNDGKFSNTSAGLVGLGGGPLSLVSQLGDQIGHKFSYCLLPHSSNSTSKLKFGAEATMSGNAVVSTPLVSKSPSTYYYLTLEGVSIGEKRVLTDQSVGNIVIDSGTTLTLLESNFYKRFEASLKEAIGVDHEPEQDPPEPFNLCYREESITAPPAMTFHFSGADVRLQGINTFMKLNNSLCLLIVPNSDRLSIFGNHAQINFQVEYDLQGKKVSFAPADCEMQ